MRSTLDWQYGYNGRIEKYDFICVRGCGITFNSMSTNCNPDHPINITLVVLSVFVLVLHYHGSFLERENRPILRDVFSISGTSIKPRPDTKILLVQCT